MPIQLYSPDVSILNVLLKDDCKSFCESHVKLAYYTLQSRQDLTELSMLNLQKQSPIFDVKNR